MSFLDTIPFVSRRSAHPKQLICKSWDDRGKVLPSDTNLFVWERELTSSVTDFAKDVTISFPEPVRLHITKAELGGQIDKARAQWVGVSTLADHDFWSDARRLTADFLDFAEGRSGTLHLKVVSDGACTKFHTDGYRLRLFTTYYGLGTEWLPEAAVDRSALGKTNESIVKDPDQVQRIGTGHVSILKGELPGQKCTVKGIVHRSPSITSIDQRRLILRIDI